MEAQAALIVPCPAADDAVCDQRVRLDPAARVGVPAHLTVAFPFKVDLTSDDHRRLTELFLCFPRFTLRGERTGWFGETVLFVQPADPAPVVSLTDAVLTAFPAYPIYGDAFAEVVPHLTVGLAQPPDVLRAAERAVLARLPFSQVVDRVELWGGPTLATAPDKSWRRLHEFRLGG